jgi:hypothetical protein
VKKSDDEKPARGQIRAGRAVSPNNGQNGGGPGGETEVVQERLPDGPLSEFILELLSSCAEHHADFPAKLMLELLGAAMDYHKKFQRALSRVKAGRAVNLEKLEDMSTEMLERICDASLKATIRDWKKLRRLALKSSWMDWDWPSGKRARPEGKKAKQSGKKPPPGGKKD